MQLLHPRFQWLRLGWFSGIFWTKTLYCTFFSKIDWWKSLNIQYDTVLFHQYHLYQHVEMLFHQIQFIFLTLQMTSSWYYTAFLADWATLNLKSHKSISVLFRSQARLSQNDLNDSSTVKWRIITDRILKMNFSNYDPL